MPTSWTLPYSDAFGNGFRPYLVLHLTGPNGRSGDVPGLIDSGADRTCLPVGFASLMGYTSANLDHQQGQQAAGAMEMWVALEPAQAYVVGAPDPVIEMRPCFVQGGQVLWGRADFFATYGVMFDEAAQQFSLIRP